MCVEENASIKWFLEGILVVYKGEGSGYWCMDIVISGWGGRVHDHKGKKVL